VPSTCWVSLRDALWGAAQSFSSGPGGEEQFRHLPSSYIHVSRAGLLPSPLQQERLASRNPLKGFCTILTLHTHLMLACSPTHCASLSCPLRWGSWVAYCRVRRLLPPQVGVLGGILPSPPVATTSGGSILLGTTVSGPWLGTLLESLQRSQQLIWWKLLSTTCIPREIYPVNILTQFIDQTV
jgi:hypothetical protein